MSVPLIIQSPHSLHAAFAWVSRAPLRTAPAFVVAAIAQVRTGNTTTATASSPLTGTVYYFWYLDGTYVGESTSPARTFVLTAADQSRIEVLASTNPAFDPIANAPAGYPPTRTLVFVRSIGTVARYRIEQQENGGAWSGIGYMQDDPAVWEYQFATARLDDLATYAWRVVPIDPFGNDGTPLAIAAELIVRTPDAPRFALTFDGATTKVTFA